MNSDEVTELSSIWDEAKGHIDGGDSDKAAEIYKYVLIRYADNAIAVEYAYFTNSILCDKLHHKVRVGRLIWKLLCKGLGSQQQQVS